MSRLDVSTPARLMGTAKTMHTCIEVAASGSANRAMQSNASWPFFGRLKYVTFFSDALVPPSISLLGIKGSCWRAWVSVTCA